MAGINPTIRERRVFAALLEEIVDHPSMAGSGIKQGDLEGAMTRFERRTVLMAEEAKQRDALYSVDTSHEDYRE